MPAENSHTPRWPHTECVVANCLTPTDRVSRRFWRQDGEEMIFLNLCESHAEMAGREFGTVVNREALQQMREADNRLLDEGADYA